MNLGELFIELLQAAAMNSTIIGATIIVLVAIVACWTVIAAIHGDPDDNWQTEEDTDGI